MKINSFGSSGINPYKRQQNNLEKIDTNQKKARDQVEISSSAKEMQQVSQFQLERQEKVEKIKLDIETGNYKVDSQKVAKSLIDFYKKN